VRKRAGKIITDSSPLATTFNNLNWCLPAAGDSDSSTETGSSHRLTLPPDQLNSFRGQL